MRQRILKNLIIVFITFILVGCNSEKPKNSLNDETTINNKKTVTLTDDIGEKNEFTQNPKYVATLFAGTTHLIAGLGDINKIVAIAQGNKRDYLFLELFPHVHNMRVVKGNNSINFEELVSSPVPEVLFVNIEGGVDNSTKEKIQKIGIELYNVHYSTFQEQINSALNIAKIMDKVQEVQPYINYYKKVIELVKTRVKTIPKEDRKSVYHAINELLRTDNLSTISAEVIKTAGGINIADDIFKNQTSLTSKNYIAVEELMKADPEYIFINGADVFDYLQKKTQFHSLKAYKNNNIYLLPLGVSRWGHPNAIETPLALLFVAKTLYPKLFEDINIKNEISNFYKDFFDTSLSNEQIEKILAGRVYKDIKGSN